MVGLTSAGAMITFEEMTMSVEVTVIPLDNDVMK